MTPVVLTAFAGLVLVALAVGWFLGLRETTPLDVAVPR